MRSEATRLPDGHPLNFRYLTSLKLIQMVPEPFGRQICLLLFSACPDIEILEVSFTTTASFFSDFFLDDVLRYYLILITIFYLEKLVFKVILRGFFTSETSKKTRNMTLKSPISSTEWY